MDHSRFGPICALTIAAVTSVMAAPTDRAAARFLEQAAWGPTDESVAAVTQLGMEGWIDAQFALPKAQWSAIPDPTQNANGNFIMRPVQDAFFRNAVHGADQLRQRVAFALGQIIVVSNVKLNAQAGVSFVRLLQTDAFENFDKVLYDVTLSPAMGRYLDMVNNNRPTAGRAANENYARELLQLFSIGLVKLDSFGRPLTGTDGKPIAAYDQDTIEGFARAFTGWTYAPATGAASRFGNPPNFDAPMIAFEANHDKAPKPLLDGFTTPANLTAEADLKLALSNIFMHRNVGPFISRQLIQRLVTSNPSENYVRRVAAAFDGPRRGDLKAVIKAILLDPEARQGDDGGANAATKLREPVLWINALLRGLRAGVQPANGLTDAAGSLGQTVYYPQTVFNYFLPGYEIQISPTESYNAPEFQLLGEDTAAGAANVVNTIAFGNLRGVTLNLARWTAVLGASPGLDDIQNMVNLLNTDLMGGRMPVRMRNTIVAAAQKAPTPQAMVQTAVYLIGSSWNYQVER